MSPPRARTFDPLDALPELRQRTLAAMAPDAKFLARLLQAEPAGATLGRLGLREVDLRYREVLGDAVAAALAETGRPA